MKLSLVVPCYNEEENIELFCAEVEKVFSPLNFDYELVLVNDGSADKTLLKLKTLCEVSTQNIKIVSFSRNFGKESAMYAGLKEASGDYVSIIDADLQQRPEIVVEMVKQLDESPEFDCVAAYQKERSEGKVLTFFKNMFYKFINKISEVEFVNGASDFRTMRADVVKSVLEMSEYHRFSKGIFSWVGFNTHYIPYTAEERNAGTSKWSFFKLFKYAFDGIVAFTTFPLKLPLIFGAIACSGSAVWLLVLLIMKLFFSASFSTALVFGVVALFMFGLNFIFLGILGEYLSKTYVQSKRRPIYIAKEILTNEKQDNKNN